MWRLPWAFLGLSWALLGLSWASWGGPGAVMGHPRASHSVPERPTDSHSVPADRLAFGLESIFRLFQTVLPYLLEEVNQPIIMNSLQYSSTAAAGGLKFLDGALSPTKEWGAPGLAGLWDCGPFFPALPGVPPHADRTWWIRRLSKGWIDNVFFCFMKSDTAATIDLGKQML